MRQGRYTVIRKLADGGMAEIFLAKMHGSQGFEKRVVLKRIHAAFSADAQFRDMLIDEAHISMGLTHTNIVQVLDLGQSADRYFLALELVDGWDFGRIIDRAAAVGVTMPLSLSLYVLAKVCRALDYAHSQKNAEGRPMGIVHRDVSPQNILVSEQGEVKLADFGIAKAQRKRDNTGTGVVKGKIAFMSPEQALGQPLDARSDLFSLGTLVYLCATGVRPFTGPTDLEVLLRVQKGEFVAPLEQCPTLPPEIAQIIDRAMAKAPERRYPSASAMLGDMEATLRGQLGSPGQTELKQWLLALSQRDGQKSIGAPIHDAPEITLESRDEDMAGRDVVLDDATRHADVGATTAAQRPSAMIGSEPTLAQLEAPPSSPSETSALISEAPQAIRVGRENSPASRYFFLLVVPVLAFVGWRYWAQLGAAPAQPSEAAEPTEEAPGAGGQPSEELDNAQDEALDPSTNTANGANEEKYPYKKGRKRAREEREEAAAQRDKPSTNIRPNGQNLEQNLEQDLVEANNPFGNDGNDGNEETEPPLPARVRPTLTPPPPALVEPPPPTGKAERELLPDAPSSADPGTESTDGANSDTHAVEPAPQIPAPEQDDDVPFTEPDRPPKPPSDRRAPDQGPGKNPDAPSKEPASDESDSLDESDEIRVPRKTEPPPSTPPIPPETQDAPDAIEPRQLNDENRPLVP